MGIAAAVAPTLPTIPQPALPDVIQGLLAKATWIGMKLQLQMTDLDRPGLIGMTESLPSYNGHRLAGAAWWTWHGTDIANPPSWWVDPPAAVVSQAKTHSVKYPLTRRIRRDPVGCG